MPLRMWLTPGQMHVILPFRDGPTESTYKLLESNDVGIIGADGVAFVDAGEPNAFGWLIVVLRSTGVIRWTGSGADKTAVEDRIGTCSADLPG